jgi:predicted small metal-binding protein
MLRFECGTVVPGCDGVVEAETADEVMSGAAGHAAAVHGLDPLGDSLVEQVRAGIAEV